MKTLSCLLLGLFCCAALLPLSSVAAPAPASTEAEGLDGEWAATSVFYEARPELGKTITGDHPKECRLSISKDVLTMTYRNTDKYKVVLSPDKKPRQIDLIVLEGRNKGGDCLGIYERNGDELKVCMDFHPGRNKRPEKFEAPGGSGWHLMVFKRVKKD